MVLVLFALLLVGIFGWLGAVIDLGRLRVVTQQLDGAAESASLEGVRFKDTQSDGFRRQRALDAVARTFDDDLDPIAGDALGLGAGSEPVIAGTGPFGGRLGPGQNYKPAAGMWLNPVNARHGDMVAGTFLASAGAEREDDLFRRSDFAPAPPDVGADEFSREPAFLVRLRRAGSRLPLDRVAGESSAGLPFEWLWARGSAWTEPGGTGSQQGRSDGVTVRATAIASTERALLVSADPVRDIGLAPIALRSGFDAAWPAVPVGANITVEVGPNGILTVGGEEQGVVVSAPARAVGQEILPATTGLAAPTASQWIVPVYTTSAGSRRAVGFARANLTIGGGNIVVERLASAVLPTGASSISPAALDARLALASSADLQAAHFAVAHPLLAPVLRR